VLHEIYDASQLAANQVNTAAISLLVHNNCRAEVHVDLLPSFIAQAK